MGKGPTKEGSSKKFAGIDIPSGLTPANFFNLYLTTWIMGCLMALPAVIQPVFLKETIGIPEELAGSINSGLQNMSQIATLLLIGLVGVASDKYGRRILVCRRTAVFNPCDSFCNRHRHGIKPSPIRHYGSGLYL